MLEELSILVDQSSAEALTDALLELGALSVTIEDAQAETLDERPLYGEPGGDNEHEAWPHSRIRILGALGSVDDILFDAAARLDLPTPTIEARTRVAESDWVAATQSQFAPILVADRLWIVPTWHDVPAGATAVIRLDPGVAFGTGTHPTTRLCLEWLAAHHVERRRVLDYGCGSGVLAMAAARFGAAEVLGIDIDPQAINAARENARLNRIDARYTDPSVLAPGAFDIVLANILSNPLMVLAPALLARVARGGSLVLSGILERQADQVMEAYAVVDAAVPLSVWRSDDGWVCLAGTRLT